MAPTYTLRRLRTLQPQSSASSSARVFVEAASRAYPVGQAQERILGDELLPIDRTVRPGSPFTSIRGRALACL